LGRFGNFCFVLLGFGHELVNCLDAINQISPRRIKFCDALI